MSDEIPLKGTEIVKTEADLHPEYEKKRQFLFFYPAERINAPGPAIPEGFVLDDSEDRVKIYPDGTYYLELRKGYDSPIKVLILPKYLWVEEREILVKKRKSASATPIVVH